MKDLLIKATDDFTITNIFYRPQGSWGNVMFLQASVILSTGWGGGGWWCLVLGGRLLPGGWWCLVPGGRCLLGGGALWRPLRDGHCCGRSSSYWNAFLCALFGRRVRRRRSCCGCRWYTRGSRTRCSGCKREPGG